MLLYLFPCLLHFFTPVNIVKYEDRRGGQMSEQGIKVAEGGLQPMIAVDKGQVQGSTDPVQRSGKGKIEIPDDLFDIPQSQCPEILAGLCRHGRRAFDAEYFCSFGSRSQVGRRQAQGSRSEEHTSEL